MDVIELPIERLDVVTNIWFINTAEAATAGVVDGGWYHLDDIVYSGLIHVRAYAVTDGFQLRPY